MVGMTKSRDEEMLEQVDPNLQPEDEGVIRRYLNYADTLLGSPDDHSPAPVPGGSPARSLAGNPEAPEKPAPGEAEDQSGAGTGKDKAA